MSITDTIRTDLRIERSMLVDFSQTNELLDSFDGLTEFVNTSEFAASEINIREICEQVRSQHNENETEEWISFQCVEKSENTLRITGVFVPTTPGILTQKRLPNGGTLYRYVIAASEGSGLFSSEIGEESILEYRLIMPGKITSADGGAIVNENTIYLTMNDFDGKDIVIESINEDHRQRIRQGAAQESRKTLQDIQETNTAVESTSSTLTLRQERICSRLGRFASRPKLLERVQERIENRFGFSCTE